MSMADCAVTAALSVSYYVVCVRVCVYMCVREHRAEEMSHNEPATHHTAPIDASTQTYFTFLHMHTYIHARVQ